jgi:nucleoside phosphorylase
LPEQAQVNIHQGADISGDSFIHQHKQLRRFARNFGSHGCRNGGRGDCSELLSIQTPFVIIRSISDLGG